MRTPHHVLITGGSGFIGQHLAVALANQGYQVTIPSRRPQRLAALRVLSNINVVDANPMQANRLEQLCEGQQVVINLIGILHERKSGDFRRVHVDYIKQLLGASEKQGIERVLHVSALGADQASGSSLYLRSKGEGENLFHTYSQRRFQATSFQPSVVFGKGDQFINRFAGLIGMTPGILPLACPGSLLSPVFVGDLVKLITNSIEDPQSYGKRYPVCGPRDYSLREIIETIAAAQGKTCRVIPLGPGLSKLQAVILQNLPGKLFTMDNYRSLQTDNICPDGGVGTTSLEFYLQRQFGVSPQQNRLDNFRREFPRADEGDSR